MSQIKSGLLAYTYLFEGTIDAPTNKQLIKLIRDESGNMDKTEVDASSRGSNGFRIKVPGLIEGTYEGQMLHTPGDVVFDTIQQAFFDNSILLMAFLDGPWEPGDALWGEEFPMDVTGMHGAYYITNFSESRAMEDVLMHDVRFSPTLEPVTLNPPIYKTENITTTVTVAARNDPPKTSL